MKKITDIEQIYSSCRREYMSGRQGQEREYKTQEVFTPDWMVEIMLDEMSNSNKSFYDTDSVYLDRAVGDGQLLSMLLIKKVERAISNDMEIHEAFVNSLDSLFGVDIESFNVKLCRERLLCGCTDPEVIKLVESRILVGNCLDPEEDIFGQSDEDKFLMKKYFHKKKSNDLMGLLARVRRFKASLAPTGLFKFGE